MAHYSLRRMSSLRRPPPATKDADRWRILAILGVGELLAMSPWLSASAVAPLLIEDWSLAGLDVALMTVAVQLGFVVGALLLAATGAADVVSGRRLFLAGALLAAHGEPGLRVRRDRPAGRPARSGSSPGSRSPASIPLA